MPPPPRPSGTRDSRVMGVNRAPVPASNQEARRAEADHDRVLLEKARRGDRQAFRALVERHQRRAFAIAYAMVRDENDAAELVQEAFLRVHRNLEAFEGGSAFFTWLYRIVTNLAIDSMRRPARREGELDVGRVCPDDFDDLHGAIVGRAEVAEPHELAHRRELGRRIAEALDELPPYHRGVIVMRELEGMSYEEIADAMGVSKGTIMSRLFHARQKLRRALAGCFREETGREPREEGES